jgi:peptidoglycan/xylan/chitin deacetylase (PgdA/CDA1 family)
MTFDDGYADNAEYALPILLRHGLSATFFIASAYLDGGQMWNDHVIAYARRNKMSVPQLDDMLRQLKYLPFDARQRVAESLAPTADPCLMLRSHQVKALAAAGMEIGAHTHEHPILSRIGDDDARRDIARKNGTGKHYATGGKPVRLSQRQPWP